MGRKKTTSKAAAVDAKRSLAATKHAVLQALCKCMHDVALKNNGKLPYGHMQSYVKENRKLYPWVTRDALNSAYTRYKKDQLGLHEVSRVEISAGSRSGSSGTMSSLSHSFNFSSDGAVVERNKGGRPTGTTYEKNRREM